MEISGSATAKVFHADFKCRAVLVKAALDNAGNVYIGGEGVTKADGTTDATTGWPLDAGQETPHWIEVDNLNKLYLIGDNAGDDIIVWVML